MAEVYYREVPGFPFYRVGSDGSVWCCSPLGRVPPSRKVAGEWRSVKPIVCRGRRYAQVSLHGKFKREVHRLVALAFLGDAPNGHEVAHINGNSLDNTVANLAYVTHADNERHKLDHGTRRRGAEVKAAKLTDDDVRAIKWRVLNGESQTSVARMYDVSDATVSGIMKGKKWAHVV